MAASPRPPKRSFVIAAFALIGLLLSVQTLRLRLAEKAVRDGNGDLAFAVRPQNGWGAALHAENLLERKDVTGAQRASKAALRTTPYAVVATRTLARSLEQTRGPRASEPVWQAASALGWRDKPTQLWALLRALSNQQADIFAMRADALLRAPGDNAAMTSLVRQAMIVPVVRDAFSARLARRPPWRAPFFDVDRPLRGKELDGTVIALVGLAGTEAPPAKQELSDAIWGLIFEGRYDEAWTLDHRFVRRTVDRGSMIDDGGFELADTDYVRNVTPFDWVVTDATATLDRSNGRRSISLTTEGSRGLAAISRYVRLAPGAYLLNYQIQGDRDSPASVTLSVTCANSATVLGSSDRTALNGDGWQARSFGFTIPSGCPMAKIEITAAKSPPGVQALVDDIAIVRR